MILVWYNNNKRNTVDSCMSYRIVENFGECKNKQNGG